jgi:Protein of unknown function (DUF3574)
MRGAFVALLVVCSAGAALAQECPAPLKPMLRAELYFGRNMAGWQVNEAQWAQFVRSELTPRFPDELTVLDARGQWREGNRLVRERSKMVIAVLSDSTKARERIAAAAEAYKTRFHQKSIGIVTQTVCAAF